MKPTVLRASEARELAALPIGGRMVIRRKVRPQPPADTVSMTDIEHPITGQFGAIPGRESVGADFDSFVACPLAPGEMRWVKEPYCLIDGLVCGYGVAYRADNATLKLEYDEGPDGNVENERLLVPHLDTREWIDDETPWKPASSMPRWASRMNVINVSTSVERDSSGVWWWRQEIERVEK
jgi:hypothetical protein